MIGYLSFEGTKQDRGHEVQGQMPVAIVGIRAVTFQRQGCDPSAHAQAVWLQRKLFLPVRHNSFPKRLEATGVRFPACAVLAATVIGSPTHPPGAQVLGGVAKGGMHAGYQ